MLHLKRTGTYLKYVKKFWNTVFDTPLHDIDQFRMYLADKNRCTLSKRERAWRSSDKVQIQVRKQHQKVGQPPFRYCLNLSEHFGVWVKV